MRALVMQKPVRKMRASSAQKPLIGLRTLTFVEARSNKVSPSEHIIQVSEASRTQSVTHVDRS